MHLDYRPTGLNGLDLEILSVTELRSRVTRGFFEATHRYTFHLLMCVSRGDCMHRVDLEPVACKPGSVLAVQPAQAHQFDPDEQWDGWLVLFRPEFLVPSNAAPPAEHWGCASGLVQSLPQPLWLQERELHLATGAMEQMREDSEIDAPRQQVHELLRHQLYALLLRLAVLHRGQTGSPFDGLNLRRFGMFQRLLDRRYAQWHGVAAYASRLGCSPKSLTRAAMAGAGLSAKDFIASRITLEAKRLLVHTVLPSAVIAEQLGFEDPANFVKFFKRAAGCTPGEFRHRQRAGSRT